MTKVLAFIYKGQNILYEQIKNIINTTNKIGFTIWRRLITIVE